MRRTCVGLLACAANMALAFFNGAQAEDYFRGKTITVIVPTAPGGGRGANATPLIEHLGKHIPGAPSVIARYMPGAGGSLGINYLANVAPRDGTFIGTPLAGALIAQVTGDPSVQYDFGHMNWIGRTTDSDEVIYVRRASPVRSLDDARQREVLIGATALSSAHAVIPLVMNEALGTRFKIVQGYTSSATVNLAVERGEIEGAATTWDNLKGNHADWLRDGDARVIAQISLAGAPDLLDTPLVNMLARDADDRALLDLVSSSADLGQSFVAPADTPPDAIAILRRAFDETMSDPDYRAIVRKIGVDLNPLTGQQLNNMNARILATPHAVLERYQRVIARAQK